LPDSAVAEQMLNLLMAPKSIIPRNISKSVIEKLLQFKAETDTIYQLAAFRLNRAHEIVAHENKMTHATLREIAERVLPPTIEKNEKGEYKKHILYAVHQAIARNDAGFRPHGEFSSVRAGGQYEISSKREIQVLAKVTAAVRAQQEIEAARSKGATLADSNLAKFAERARHLIDRSRQTREVGISNIAKLKLTIPSLLSTAPYLRGNPKFRMIKLETRSERARYIPTSTTIRWKNMPNS
jgi:hypothetical protein